MLLGLCVSAVMSGADLFQYPTSVNYSLSPIQSFNNDENGCVQACLTHTNCTASLFMNNNCYNQFYSMSQENCGSATPCILQVLKSISLFIVTIYQSGFLISVPCSKSYMCHFYRKQCACVDAYGKVTGTVFYWRDVQKRICLYSETEAAAIAFYCG